MMRFLPSRAAIAAFFLAVCATVAAFLRRDARRDAQTETREKDQTNALEIEDRVGRSRADPKRLRPFDGAGWRD